ADAALAAHTAAGGDELDAEYAAVVAVQVDLDAALAADPLVTATITGLTTDLDAAVVELEAATDALTDALDAAATADGLADAALAAHTAAGGDELDAEYAAVVAVQVDLDAALAADPLVTADIVAATTALNDAVWDLELTTAPLVVFDISLYRGWNLISLPLMPSSVDPEEILEGLDGASATIIWGNYDPATGSWESYAPAAEENSLTTMRDGRGYWVRTDGDATLTVTGRELPLPPGVPPAYNVVPGWNLIGFKSLDSRLAEDYLEAIAGKYTLIYGFDGENHLYVLVIASDDDMSPGAGYWIAVTQSGTIFP
ncbi:MAG: hypothetical protein PHQ43_03160, partial [Dehalococcoidales bacterium]|nr:hypothetical protein [Dehalococcoidales bacterium]